MAITADDLRHGREANRPREIPKEGWRDILLRVKAELGQDYLGMAAAGVAFYALLAIFPAIAALVSIYGLVFDPGDVQRHADMITSVMPPAAAGIIETQLQRLVSQSTTGLGWGAALGIVLALWSAAKGVKAVIKALNIAYDEDEKRGFFKLNATALLLTLVGVAFAIVALLLIAVLPPLLGMLGLPVAAQTAISWLRWPILLAAVFGLVVLFYRYGPNRTKPRWPWVSWGAVGATVLWLLGSMLFSFYVSNFGSFGETYGSLGAVVILMLWLWLSSYIILLGAEFNAEVEHQTRRDTTAGPERPLGQRGAYVADTVGHSPR